MNRVARVLPALAAIVAFALYVRTLYPGLVSIGDSPKFQFVGRIWGTPHNPGYPLYVVVSHVFSHLPLGTLAYRINLMSAVFGALTVGLVAALVRRLTGSAAVGAGAALAFGFGRVFWSQAIIAEVYTLGSALLAASLLFLLRWSDRRRTGDLLLAVAAVSLAVGNHLTIVMVVPALIFFVLASDWRVVRNRSIVFPGAVIVALGVLQYGLIVYWTARNPPYLESSARNIAELVGVMRGAQFADRVGGADLPILFNRNVALLSIVVSELRWWGVALAVAGLGILLRRRWRVAALLLIGSAGVWVFLLHYEMADPQVFLIPVFLMLACASGAALAEILGWFGRRGRLAAPFAAAAVALVPAASLALENYRASDHHRRTYETRLFDSVFRTIPDRTVLVPGSFANHLMLTYKLEGEKAAGSRDVRQAEPDVTELRQWQQRGYRLFALDAAADALRHTGAVLEPLQLWDVPLSQHLEGLPEGLVVAIAGVGLGSGMPPGAGPSLRQIGGRASLFGRRDDAYAVVGVTGASEGAVESVGRHQAVKVQAGTPIGPLAQGLPVAIEARDEVGGRIAIADQEVVSAPGALAFAVLAPDGTVVAAGRIDPARQLRVPFAGAQLYEVTGYRACRDIGNSGWQDVGSIAAEGKLWIRLDNYRPFDSKVVLVTAADPRAAPALVQWNGPGTPQVRVLTADAETIRAAGLPDEVAARHTWTHILDIVVNDDGRNETLTIGVGETVRAAWMTISVDLNNPRRATVCSGPAQ